MCPVTIYAIPIISILKWSHVEFKECPYSFHVSNIFPHVDFKKWRSHSVEFKDQEPQPSPAISHNHNRAALLSAHRIPEQLIALYILIIRASLLLHSYLHIYCLCKQCYLFSPNTSYGGSSSANELDWEVRCFCLEIGRKALLTRLSV